jgi:hypothetical protein
MSSKLVPSQLGFIAATLGCLVLASCAGSYRRPESFEAKMARFRPRNDNPNTVPTIELDPRMPQQLKAPARRGPASSRAPQLKKLPSNKRLYFITLYGQYRALSSYIHTEQAPDIKHCPSFHTTMVNYKEGLPPVQSQKVSFENRYPKELHADVITSYPELALPMTLSDKRPRLYDVLKDPEAKTGRTTTFYVTQALKVHLTKTYKELEELCDSGTSENYYNYENLTTHIQREGEHFSPTKESLQILLRTTLFSNMTLLKGLSKTQGGRVPASATAPNPYEEGLIEKFGLQWTQSYFDSLKK